MNGFGAGAGSIQEVDRTSNHTLGVQRFAYREIRVKKSIKDSAVVSTRLVAQLQVWAHSVEPASWSQTFVPVSLVLRVSGNWSDVAVMQQA